jgi:hypothetical protein
MLLVGRPSLGLAISVRRGRESEERKVERVISEGGERSVRRRRGREKRGIREGGERDPGNFLF